MLCFILMHVISAYGMFLFGTLFQSPSLSPDSIDLTGNEQRHYPTISFPIVLAMIHTKYTRNPLKNRSHFRTAYKHTSCWRTHMKTRGTFIIKLYSEVHANGRYFILVSRKRCSDLHSEVRSKFFL